MIRNTHKRILLSASLLSAGSVLSLATAGTAAPRNGNNGRNDVKQERRDVKEARKEVKQERKDARKADTPGERRDARQDVREAQRDLRNERQDVRQERREDNRYDNRGHNPNWNRPNPPVIHPNNTNPRWTRPNPNTQPQYRPGYNSGYNPGQYPQYNPGHNPQYNPGYNTGYNNGYDNGNWSQQSTTIEGTVISDNRGNGFTLRATSGQIWQVQVQGAEPVGLSRGDVVRVFGPTRNNTVLAGGLRILQNR